MGSSAHHFASNKEEQKSMHFRTPLKSRVYDTFLPKFVNLTSIHQGEFFIDRLVTAFPTARLDWFFLQRKNDC